MSLDAIGIVSSDLKSSIEFYALLGVSLKETGGPDHFEGSTPSGIRIILDSAELMKKINPDWIHPTGSGVVLCFKQVSPEKVNELYTKIIESGHKTIKAPWDAFWRQRYCSVLDPGGNQIDIFAPL